MFIANIQIGKLFFHPTWYQVEIVLFPPVTSETLQLQPITRSTNVYCQTSIYQCWKFIKHQMTHSIYISPEVKLWPIHRFWFQKACVCACRAVFVHQTEGLPPCFWINNNTSCIFSVFFVAERGGLWRGGSEQCHPTSPHQRGHQALQPQDWPALPLLST